MSPQRKKRHLNSDTSHSYNLFDLHMVRLMVMLTSCFYLGLRLMGGGDFWNVGVPSIPALS